MIAINTIRQLPHYRHDAFDAGLLRMGYRLEKSGKPASREDLLILWNRQGAEEQRANDWEALGGTVLVCENGYIGKDAGGLQFYAISVHGHNGSGWFPVGEEDRFTPLNIALRPWVENTGHILVCGQRGIGSRLMASPPSWEDKTARTLKAMGQDKIKIRRHPGNYKPETTLDEDLIGARLCVVWSSASGVKALTLGIPMVYAAPHWICEEAGTKFQHADIATPTRSDESRQRALHRMSHGQWAVEEIQNGEPFARIMAQIGSATW